MSDSIPTDNGTDPDLTRFQYDILGALANAEDSTRYGLGLKDDLEQRYDLEVNHGRLYPNLDDLVAAGLVAKGSIDKRTNSYTLTADGTRALASRARWLTGQAEPDEVAAREEVSA